MSRTTSPGERQRREVPALVQSIWSADAVRSRCAQVQQFVETGKSQHFSLNLSKLPEIAELVARITREQYPSLEIPYHGRWGHFNPPGVKRDRTSQIRAALRNHSLLDRGTALYDLAIISVLLDAGAGTAWRFRDQDGFTIGRSEGLALASFDAFVSGAFSADPEEPLRVDGERLAALTLSDLETVFQVSAENPLVGLPGRLELLQRLGRTASQDQELAGRPGGFFSLLWKGSEPTSNSRVIQAARVLEVILQKFSDIWPGRIQLLGFSLGDVWRHQAVRTSDETSGLVAFHKLSQWLTYSLLEPLEWSGAAIEGLDRLTGLAEYRNGGLFLDGGVIQARSPELLARRWKVEDEFVVEWRALTVNLLDQLHPLVAKKLGLSCAEFPLAKLLQGGTWSSGRALAAQLRPGAAPPIQIESDGTVF